MQDSIKIYGHETTIQIFETLINNSTLPHGILLSGKGSIGKRKLARYIASRILSSKIKEQAVKIQHEHLISIGQYPDLILISPEDGKSNIKVEQIRALKESLSLSPYYGNAIVSIIDDAHTLNISAANSLLKTLEEPEKDKYIILVSDSPHLLTPTLRSRCHNFSCSQLSREDISKIIVELFAGLIQEDLIIKLSSYMKGSLAAISISELIDERTLKISDEENARDKLSNLISKLEEILSKIEYVFKYDRDSSEFYSGIIQLISSYEKQNEISIVWDLLIEKINLLSKRSNRLEESCYWSELLIELSVKKREVDSRNLNSSLQFVSSL